MLILTGQISLAMVRRLCSTVSASSATTAGSSVRSAAELVVTHATAVFLY